MKASLDCLPCVVNQALNSVSRATDDPILRERALREVLSRLAAADYDRTPAELSMIAHWVAQEVSGVDDPYVGEKREHNRLALELLPELRATVAAAEDPLLAALLLAAAGNVIDLGLNQEFDLQRDIRGQLEHGFSREEYAAFREAVAGAHQVLYIGDNAGEIVFDRLVVEQLLPREITFVVKGGPIVNDAMREDADQVGLTELVRIIDTGIGEFGFIRDHVTDECRQAFRGADLVVSKGHANFETVSELGPEGDKAFYVVKAKCAQVARMLGVPMGGVVLLSHGTLRGGRG